MSGRLAEIEALVRIPSSHTDVPAPYWTHPMAEGVRWLCAELERTRRQLSAATTSPSLPADPRR